MTEERHHTDELRPQPAATLLNFLHELQPRTLLFIGQQIPQALAHWCKEHHCRIERLDEPAQVMQLSSSDQFEAAILGLSSVLHAQRVLGQLKNLHTRAIWLWVGESASMPDGSLLSLGFKRLSHHPELGIATYAYTLDSYNRKRSWNTPKYWANPENWGKYWW